MSGLSAAYVRVHDGASRGVHVCAYVFRGVAPVGDAVVCVLGAETGAQHAACGVFHHGECAETALIFADHDVLGRGRAGCRHQ